MEWNGFPAESICFAGGPFQGIQQNAGTVQKTKLLIISYLFPPQGGIAVQRVLSFVRYLPREHYEIHVLAAWNAACPIVDRSLVHLVPDSIRIHRALMPGLPFGWRQRVREIGRASCWERG